jgi:hypothetical protein
MATQEDLEVQRTREEAEWHLKEEKRVRKNKIISHIIWMGILFIFFRFFFIPSCLGGESFIGSGTYVGNTPYGELTIVLNSDGTATYKLLSSEFKTSWDNMGFDGYAYFHDGYDFVITYDDGNYYYYNTDHDMKAKRDGIKMTKK